MKSIACALILVSTLSPAIPSVAKTASGKIAVSAQIVPGNSVSVYLTGGSVTTIVRGADAPEQSAAPNADSLLRVTFDMSSSWFLVKRVTWDKPRRHLTIDF